MRARLSSAIASSVVMMVGCMKEWSYLLSLGGSDVLEHEVQTPWLIPTASLLKWFTRAGKPKDKLDDTFL